MIKKLLTRYKAWLKQRAEDEKDRGLQWAMEQYNIHNETAGSLRAKVENSKTFGSFCYFDQGVMQAVDFIEGFGNGLQAGIKEGLNGKSA